MAKKTQGMELIYSDQTTDFISGRAYSNPRFYTTPRSGVTKVFLVGDWPKIAADYQALGVAVEPLDAASATGQPADPELQAPPAALTPVPVEQRDTVNIPADWSELPWTQAGDADGLTLRGLASDLSDAPILNKKQAKAAILAELDRRGAAIEVDPLDAPQDDAGGLTIRELHASLEGLGLAFDPADTPAAKFAQLNEARAILAE